MAARHKYLFSLTGRPLAAWHYHLKKALQAARKTNYSSMSLKQMLEMQIALLCWLFPNPNCTCADMLHIP